MAYDDDIAALAAAIDRDRIRRARLRTIEEKVLSGGDLFDDVRVRMIAGIRWQYPDFDDAQVQAEFVRRLRIARRNERRPAPGAGE